MMLRGWTRWGGVAAALGGALWIAGAVLTALKPEGCIAGECDLPGRSMREGTELDGVLFVSAVLLISLGALALAARARAAGRLGRLGRVGLGAGLVGAGMVLLASVVQATVFGGDFPYMPVVVIPAGLAVVLGFLLFGGAIIRARVLPRWASTLLVIGTLLMLGFNDQNAQALLAIPFGLAWIAAGYALWATPGEQTAGLSSLRSEQ